MFNGKDFTGWDGPVDNYEVADGAIVCKPKKGGNIHTKAEFADHVIRLEYKLPPGGNNGLAVRYPGNNVHVATQAMCELQILDDLADTNTEKFLTQAAIYGRRAPDVKASKAPAEWQTLEAVMVANRVTVTLNGTIVHNNQPVVGVTGGALDNDETSPGPIMIQGDHEKVWIRRLVVTPIVTPGK